MNPTIAVLGASGVYGRHLVPRLLARGYRVRALVRRPERAGFVARCGAEVVKADIFDGASLSEGLAGVEVALHLATQLPRPDVPGGDFAKTDELRRVGTARFLDACRARSVGRVLVQSIALTHWGGEWADETSAFVEAEGVAGAAIAAVRDMEALVENSGLDWVVLRGALFYGPGTGFDDDWFARARAGRLRLPAEGTDYVSLVHVADMAQATLCALDRWPSRRALIVADDEPVTWRTLFEWVAAEVGASPPAPGGRSLLPSFRVRNGLAKALLGWLPLYASFRTGLAR